MKTQVFLILMAGIGLVAVAQEEMRQLPPPVSVPFEQQHVTLPIPEAEVMDLFSAGCQTLGGEVGMIRIASRHAPEKSFFAKIGDAVGRYRIDRVTGEGRNYAVYLVNSNATVVIRARTASETHLNTIERPGGKVVDTLPSKSREDGVSE